MAKERKNKGSKYNPLDVFSIFEYSKQLVGCTLRRFVERGESIKEYKGKAAWGRW